MPAVKDVLQKKGAEVLCVESDTTVREATQRMNEHKIGAVVITRGDHVVGIFSERDVLTRVVAAGRDPQSVVVREAMTSPVACCGLDTKLAECRAVMTENRIRHLPVVEQGRLVGIISSGDILAREHEQHLDTIRWLNEYMYGPTPSAGGGSDAAS